MKTPPRVSGPRQLSLGLTIEKEVEIDGVGMGVLSDGTPFLTGRGLARMCGVDHMIINRMTSGWILPDLRPRERKIKENLRQQGIVLEKPYIPIPVDGVLHYAYPDVVCMAVLEYYAFEAGQASNGQAIKNYRLLARKSFREFIYTQIGYSPNRAIPLVWQQFHDRVSLTYDSVPFGYFSIFKEVADIVVTLIHAGAAIGPEFIPDISIGGHWAKHWRDRNLEARFGARVHYPHNYPDYFLQAASNPQRAHCYPDDALGEFRRWMWETYLPEKLPDYLDSKVSQGALPPSFSEMAVRVFEARKPVKKLS